MQFCTKLAVICRSNIGLLSFSFFTPFHDGGSFYDAITNKFEIFLLINDSHVLGDNRIGKSHDLGISLTHVFGFLVRVSNIR